mgnify:FL=1
MEQKNEDPSNEINSIEKKLPAFFTDENGSPLKWIEFSKALLHFSGINNKNSICYYILANLPSHITLDIADQLNAIREDKEPLEKLIAILKSKQRINKKQLLDSCLSNYQLGDKVPSDLLRTIKNKLEYVQPNITMSENPELLKEVFLRNLPPDTRRILAATTNTSLEDLAIIADKIHEDQGATINYINRPREHIPPPPHLDTNQLLLKVMETQNQLMLKFNEVLQSNTQALKEIQESTRFREPFRPRPRSNSRNRSYSPNPDFQTQKKPQGLCYFHQKFGSRAFKCTAPCSWKPNNNQENQQSHD